ncbi:MFS transporter [Candidatus Wolfebacteria bacterium]|nr:MFS transporter [Candidatus Wolfebacteria bacterium]
MESALDRKTIIRLSIVFALIYFFSPNGLASLPGLTISFLLKDILKMTATQTAYFSAITIIGWAIKPLWGIISDAVPICGYRRKSYLVITTIAAAIIWLILGQIENYDTRTLITLFALSSLAYAFMDVVCDALMIETGKPHNLTGRFQSIQWTAVYVAAIIASLAGGWVAENLKPQSVFSLNAAFPLIILVVVLFFLKENKVFDRKEQFQASRSSLKHAFGGKAIWLLAFFLFFWTFSPSFGAPFFYYSVDNLKFDKIFLGIVGAVGAGASALGAILYGKFSNKFRTRTFIEWMIAIGIAATLFDLIYFAPFVTKNLFLARTIYVSSAAVLGIIGAFTFLVMLNAAAISVPKYSEGTTFAVLTSFWNIGLMGSSALGGFLFSKIGLQPLIVVSAIFTAATWLILPYLKFSDENA